MLTQDEQYIRYVSYFSLSLRIELLVLSLDPLNIINEILIRSGRSWFHATIYL